MTTPKAAKKPITSVKISLDDRTYKNRERRIFEQMTQGGELDPCLMKVQMSALDVRANLDGVGEVDIDPRDDEGNPVKTSVILEALQYIAARRLDPDFPADEALDLDYEFEATSPKGSAKK